MVDDLRTTLNVTRAAVSRQRERETGRPVGDPMTATDARRLTDRIKFDAGQLWDRITEAYLGRADIALDYPSWDSYCSTEFGSLRLRLPREERREAVCSLRESGLSIRAIASATGADPKTVQTDLKSGVGNSHTSAEVDEQVVELDEDALAERLIGAEKSVTREPTRFNVTRQTVTVEPARQLTLVVTGLDRKTYQPRSGIPEPLTPEEESARINAQVPTVGECFEQEMGILDHSIDRLFGLVAKATDVERAELASRWADVVVDRAARLSVIHRKVRD